MARNRCQWPLRRADRPPGFFVGEGGFTLPFVLVMIALALVAVSATTFLASHIRSVAAAEDGERVYYALDAAVEAVMADLVRGADAVDASYTPPAVTLNDITPSVTTTAPGAVATPTPTQQYFDPGVRNPEMLNIPANSGYLLHILNLYPSQGAVTSTLDVSWSFSIAGPSPSADGVRIRLFNDKAAVAPGRTTGCPSGNELAAVNKNFTGAGPHNIRLDLFEITQPAVYSIAFCITTLNGTLTTEPFKPTGTLDDTWVFAIALKDYQITADAEGASVTAYVRQVPGPTEPPTGNWADNNISWIANLVTPYQWER